MTIRDMTLAEFVEAKRALEKEIGPMADVFVRVGGRYSAAPLSASVYPNSMAGNALGRVEADTFSELLRLVREKWETGSYVVAQTTISDMALAIIDLTHRGECTADALRRKFGAGAIERHADAALKRAGEMTNRSFEIAGTAGADAA